MAEKKSSLMAVLEVLKEYSDADHILPRAEILAKIERDRGIRIDRRTLYTNLSVLKEYGYDISDYEVNGKGYALIDREFSPAEITWLCNAIHASNFISRNDSERLISKLLKTQSAFERSAYSSTVYLPNNRKTENTELFDSIAAITSAIREHQKITFTYLRYNMDKKLVEKRRKLYTVDPYYIVYFEGKAYLIGINAEHDGFSHYRLDKMRKVNAVEGSVVIYPQNEQDPYDYAKNKLFMFAGKNTAATFKCRMYILDQMVDLFGNDMTITKRDEDHFMMTINAPKQGIIWLAQQFVDCIQLVSPADIRASVRENLEAALSEYQD